jgi:hypothetical protein
MAFTVTRYRVNNPGQDSRGFDVTALFDDTTYSFLHRCLWTPDSWVFQSTDGSGCTYIGLWRGTLSTNVDPNDTFTITKENVAASGGAVRLTLGHLSVRP